jgi:hypothetical protein
MIVRVHHLRLVRGYSARPGLCNRGARAWFAQRGWDWSAFVRDGIASDVLLATGDGFAIALVQAALAAESTP